jgi:ABC-type nitrate/sulfonate/bicarbonate transport system ATPase subunit
MGTPAIQVSNLSVALGIPAVQVLSDVSLTIHQGEILALVGKSGTGKSTLINAIGGLVPHTSGNIQRAQGIHGELRTATVFQSPRLFPWLSALDNVALSLTYRSHPSHTKKKSARRAIAREVLASLDIEEYAHRKPHELSGGQQQRVGIARAVTSRPDVLLLDEPFSALDVATRSSLQEWLVEHRADLAPTVVLVTHDLSEALYVADRIALLTDDSGDLPVWSSDVRHRDHIPQSAVREEIERCFFDVASTFTS